MAGPRRFVAPERRRVGLVFQDHALFPHLTVARNVGFGLDRLSRPERAARVAEVLALVRLGDLAARYPHELSGGEQQRVALARALAPGPTVVLLDEPFSSLDETLRAQVRAEPSGCSARPGPPPCSSPTTRPRRSRSATGSSSCATGRVEQEDTPQGVFERPATRFVASFMGDADFLPAHVHDALLTCEIGIVSTRARLGRTSTPTWRWSCVRTRWR